MGEHIVVMRRSEVDRSLLDFHRPVMGPWASRD